MKQILIRKGRPLVAEIPPPQALPGMIRVAVRASCISPGTEKAGIAASGASLLQRAWDQPERCDRPWRAVGERTGPRSQVCHSGQPVYRTRSWARIVRIFSSRSLTCRSYPRSEGS